LKTRRGYARGNTGTKQVYHEGGKQSTQTGRFTRRIGSTTYHVTVHFSQTSKETMDDKMLRMIQNEIATREVVNT